MYNIGYYVDTYAWNCECRNGKILQLQLNKNEPEAVLFKSF